MPTDVELLGSDPAPAAEADIQPDTSVVDPAATTDAAASSEGTEAVIDPATQAVDPNAPPADPTQEDLDLMPAAAEDPLTVKALNDKITKSAELQAAIAKDPGLRNLLYSTARLAHETQEYKQLFRTPALAKTALDLANRHIEFENTVRSTPQTAVEALYGLTAPRDEQGNILWDQPNPEYQAAMTFWREANLWAPAMELAESLGDKPLTLPNGQTIPGADLRDALAIVSIFLGDKVNSTSPFLKPGQGGAAAGSRPALDQETQSKLTRLDELERVQRDNQVQQQHTYAESVRTGIHDGVSKAAKTYLDNLVKNNSQVVMTDYIKAVVVDKAIQEVYDLARQDQSYQNHINFIFKSSPRKDEELKGKLLTEATKYARERLPKLIAKHISEASKGAVATQQARAAKQTAQTQRPEVQGTAGVTTPSRQDPAVQVREFIQKNKRKPTDREMLDF